MKRSLRLIDGFKATPRRHRFLYRLPCLGHVFPHRYKAVNLARPMAQDDANPIFPQPRGIGQAFVNENVVSGGGDERWRRPYKSFSQQG